MKKYISILIIFAVALLFVGQSDTLAKTAKDATAELSKDRDGETYYQLKAPKTYKYKSVDVEDKDVYRFSRWYLTEIESLQDRVRRIWDQVLPIIYKKYYKTVAVVD